MLNHTGTVEIRTSRLLLRRCMQEDVLSMYENWQKDPQVTKYLTWGPYENLEQAQAYAAKLSLGFERADFYDWLIVLDDLPIGAIGAIVDEKNEAAQVGYCLGTHWWGQGIMTEALSAVLDHLIGNVGFQRVYARHHVENAASGRVMEKCGMQYEGTLRKSERMKDGALGDVAYHSILREEWLARHGA